MPGAANRCGKALLRAVQGRTGSLLRPDEFVGNAHVARKPTDVRGTGSQVGQGQIRDQFQGDHAAPIQASLRPICVAGSEADVEASL